MKIEIPTEKEILESMSYGCRFSFPETGDLKRNVNSAIYAFEQLKAKNMDEWCKDSIALGIEYGMALMNERINGCKSAEVTN